MLKNKLWFLILLLISGIPLSFFLLRNNNDQVKKKIEVSKPIPTPIPFYDITIQYLREKTYTSNLGNLEISYQGSNYSAYLTSFTSDGFRVNGLLTKPKGEVPQNGWPAIVFVHGYIPPKQYKTTQQYYDYVDYLARNGFVVFKIDLRGHGNSEGESGGAYYSSDYVRDVLYAYAALQSSGFVNPEKIGLWGHSMAGNVVIRSMAAKPDIPAVVIWAGAVYTYTDFQEFGISDNSYQSPQMSSERVKRRQQLIATHGNPTKESSFWKMVAPTSFLTDLKGAVQIHHAVNDEVVDIRYSRNLDSLLNKTTVPHELIEYPSGGHNITGGSFTRAMQKTVEFFDKYLKKE